MPPRTPDPTRVTPQVLRDWPLPDPVGDKNTRGAILVIGGSTETLGAVLLAAEAAMRAGAGTLQVATLESTAGLAALALPDALVRSLPETSGGALGPDAADAFRVGVYYHTLAGGPNIDCAMLGKFDQKLLKTTFASIERFLEFTVNTMVPVE